MGSVSVCPRARAQRGFTGTKESAHLSLTQSWPYPFPTECGGWRVEIGGWRVEPGGCCTGCESWQGKRACVGLLMRGHMSEQWSYLNPTNPRIFFTLKEKFRFLKCRSLFNVTRS